MAGPVFPPAQVLLSAALLLPAVAANAQSEEGVFSSEGVQLHTDARVYVLYGILNARGYDRETERGPPPTDAPRYSALRVHVRDTLKLGVDVEKAADTFLAGHADTPVRYLRAALALEDAPKFGVPEGADLGGYEGLSKLLAGAWSAGAAEAYDSDTVELRRASKEMLPVVDARAAELRKVLRLEATAEDLLAAESEGGDKVVVIFNVLDAHGMQLRHAVPGVRYVIMGPWKAVADKGVADPVIVEVARMLLAPEVKKVAKAPELAAYAARTGPAGAALGKPDEVVLEALSRAAARKVLGRPLLLRTGFDAEPELPGEADLLRELEAFAATQDKLADALPALLGRAAGTPPAAAETVPPAAAPAATPPAKEPPKPVPAKEPAKPAPAKPAKGG
ncbi:MAG: hypothetical protein HY904_25450 [Deltaproteobacteria bacterium]|nr:hypothetical protein [Deltaproteobacteria bacterium]